MNNKTIKIIKANQSPNTSKNTPKQSTKRHTDRAASHKIAENINSWVEESRRQKESLRLLALKNFGSLNQEPNFDFV